MDNFHVKGTVPRPARGARRHALIGVNASGNLEVLVERVLTLHECEIQVATAVIGFRELWEAVIAEFLARCSPGGLRFSINDGGARPDMVTLRLMQALRLMEVGP